MRDLCKVEVKGFNEFDLCIYDILLVNYVPFRKKGQYKAFTLRIVAQSGAYLLVLCRNLDCRF